ncbi:MAG: xanthine dehydrogenase family protein subunit M [Bacteroidia bacterium]
MINVQNKKYLLPNSIDEAVDMFHCHESAKYIAGGTDCVLNFKQKNTVAEVWIDITKIRDLNDICVGRDSISIGSCVKLSDIVKHKELYDYLPILRDAAKKIATPVIRMNATVGGNLLCENRCIFYNQSEWWRNAIGRCLKCEGDVCIATGGKKNCFSKNSSDMAPALLVCDAEIDIIGKGKNKRMKLVELYTGDGIRPFNINAGDLITCIHLPVVRRRYFYFKLRQRESIDFSSMTIAASYDMEKKILKVAVGGCDPAPVLWEFGVDEKFDFDTIRQRVKKIRIVDNDYYPREYRKAYLLQRLEEICKAVKQS